MVKEKHRGSLVKVIIITGLVAGILDGSAALIQLTIRGSKNPLSVFNYIASGVFGDAALSGGNSMMVVGVIFHLSIATIWTALFFLSYKYINGPVKNWRLAGFLYGIVVWAGMNLVVLPLSNIPPRNITVSGSITAALILILCIGLPVSYSANRYFRQTHV